MEQPQAAGAVPQSSRPRPGGKNPPSSSSQQKNQNQKIPTPKELISHYESKGLDTQEASIRVIEDLQTVVMRMVASERGRKDRLMSDISRKVDSTNNRLAILEMKLDSKPGFLETFAIGLASGAALPHILGGLGQIWNAVTSITKPPPSSSS